MAEIIRRLRITGRVQGVFYRAWAIETANGLGLAGWVRNRRDGSVEALVAGEGQAVERFIERCRQGPAAADVADVAVSEAEAEDEPFTGFEKRPTA